MAQTVEDQGQQPPSATERTDRQDIRLGVVMTGGVSLAVWISGVTLEVFRLATARTDAGSPYASLLDLLRADVRVDVVSGTSAGGLNGAFLALGLARGGDLSVMRDLWREHGSLDRLLRDPLTRCPKSLLKGDDYFLPRVREALEKLISSATTSSVRIDDEPAPVELVLTGTLWQGRSTTFTDDLGVAITETDHDATFRFADLRAGCRNGRPVSGDLAADAVLDELAAAARCTSSFPGAFEPHFVQVTSGDPDGDLRWESAAGRSNFREGQHVVDGGVLLNKPIRPALEAVYRRTAGFQVPGCWRTSLRIRVNNSAPPPPPTRPSGHTLTRPDRGCQSRRPTRCCSESSPGLDFRIPLEPMCQFGLVAGSGCRRGRGRS